MHHDIFDPRLRLQMIRIHAGSGPTLVVKTQVARYIPPLVHVNGPVR